MQSLLPEIITAKDRALELFMCVDGFGEPVYSLREIERTLTNEGYKVTDTTIAKWRDDESWARKRDALIMNAMVTRAPKDVPQSLFSMEDVNKYVNAMKRIDSKASDLIERGLDELLNAPKLTNKDLAVIVKIKEVSSKSIDLMMERAEKGEQHSENIDVIRMAMAASYRARAINEQQ